MPAFSSLIYLIFGCQETPPYDLSQIPIKDEDPALSTPSTPSATSTSPPPLTRDGSTNKPPMKCLPPNETEKEIDLEGKIVLDLTLPIEAKDHQIILDFVQPSVGNIVYGIVCEGNQLKVPVKQNLGTVQLAVFIDTDKDGPSEKDVQGLSLEFVVGNQNISMDNIVLGETPLPIYNFGKEDNKNPPEELPPPPK